MARGVAQRLLRDTIQRSRERCGNWRIEFRRVHLHVERRLRSRLPSQPLERRNEAQVVEHAGMHGVGERSHFLQRFRGELAQRRNPRVQRGGGAFPCSGAELEHHRRENLRRGVMQLARDAGALLVLRADHLRGKLTFARTILGEPVEQRVERRAHTRHVTVGEHTRWDTRRHVPRRETRRRGLEIGERTQRDEDEREIHDEARTERDAENRHDADRGVQPALDCHADECGDDDEQIGTRDLGEEGNTEYALHNGSRIKHSSPRPRPYRPCMNGMTKPASPRIRSLATPRPSSDPITFPVPEYPPIAHTPLRTSRTIGNSSFV